MVTYNPPTRNRFNVWSYADDRAPPGRMSAHSDPPPIVFNSTGCKNCAKVAHVVNIEAIIRNLKWKKKKIFVKIRKKWMTKLKKVYDPNGFNGEIGEWHTIFRIFYSWKKKKHFFRDFQIFLFVWIFMIFSGTHSFIQLQSFRNRKFGEKIRKLRYLKLATFRSKNCTNSSRSFWMKKTTKDTVKWKNGQKARQKQSVAWSVDTYN